MRIVLDALGGDNAPHAAIEGGLMALNTYDDFTLILSGDQAAIEEALKEQSYPKERLEILHAPDSISCEESPTLAIKRKKDSSLVKALEYVRDGHADCIVSAGSSGAVLAGATLIIRRIKGVKRPALVTLLPRPDGGCLALADSGANTDWRPSFLLQFAAMAKAYLEGVAGVKEPRIGLLNNGAEAEKGNALTKEAYKLLSASDMNFAGNCEARDILSGRYDVLVCDGFDGNVVLKYTEGLASAFTSMLKTELMADPRSKIGALLSKPAFRRFKKKMDYTEYGGAPLLGINGGVIKAHGSSNSKAFCSAIRQARLFIQNGVNAKIIEALSQLPEIED